MLVAGLGEMLVRQQVALMKQVQSLWTQHGILPLGNIAWPWSWSEWGLTRGSAGSWQCRLRQVTLPPGP